MKTTIIAEPNNVEKITKATCINTYLRTTNIPAYTPPGYADSVDPSGQINKGSWRKNVSGAGLQPLVRQGQRNHTAAAAEIREKFMQFYNSQAGQLKWQLDYIQRTY